MGQMNKIEKIPQRAGKGKKELTLDILQNVKSPSLSLVHSNSKRSSAQCDCNDRV